MKVTKDITIFFDPNKDPIEHKEVSSDDIEWILKSVKYSKPVVNIEVWDNEGSNTIVNAIDSFVTHDQDKFIAFVRMLYNNEVYDTCRNITIGVSEGYTEALSYCASLPHQVGIPYGCRRESSRDHFESLLVGMIFTVGDHKSFAIEDISSIEYVISFIENIGYPIINQNVLDIIKIIHANEIHINANNESIELLKSLMSPIQLSVLKELMFRRTIRREGVNVFDIINSESLSEEQSLGMSLDLEQCMHRLALRFLKEEMELHSVNLKKSDTNIDSLNDKDGDEFLENVKLLRTALVGRRFVANCMQNHLDKSSKQKEKEDMPF